jgi:hypothetical protein
MSKQALISPNEPRENGYRVAQVVDEGQTFEVGGLFWTPCDDACVADLWYYNTEIKECVPNPIEPEPIEPTPEGAA